MIKKIRAEANVMAAVPGASIYLEGVVRPNVAHKVWNQVRPTVEWRTSRICRELTSFFGI